MLSHTRSLIVQQWKDRLFDEYIETGYCKMTKSRFLKLMDKTNTNDDKCIDEVYEHYVKQLDEYGKRHKERQTKGNGNKDSKMPKRKPTRKNADSQQTEPAQNQTNMKRKKMMTSHHYRMMTHQFL